MFLTLVHAVVSISSPVGTDGGDMSKLHVSQSSHTGGGRPTVPVFSDDMGKLILCSLSHFSI